MFDSHLGDVRTVFLGRNVENHWPTVQDGIGKAAFPAYAGAASRRQVVILSFSCTEITLCGQQRSCSVGPSNPVALLASIVPRVLTGYARDKIQQPLMSNLEGPSKSLLLKMGNARQDLDGFFMAGTAH